jgi:quercetin dioxygenase-like cupin family protein
LGSLLISTISRIHGPSNKSEKKIIRLNFLITVHFFSCLYFADLLQLIKSSISLSAISTKVIMKKKAVITGFVIGLFMSAKAQTTTNFNGRKTPPQVLLDQVLNTPSLKNQEFKMVLVTFQPGEIGTAHRHPIPTFAYVIEGEFESTFDGKVYHYKAGDTFYEEPNKLHGETRTIGDKAVKMLAIFIGDKGKPFLVPEKK